MGFISGSKVSVDHYNHIIIDEFSKNQGLLGFDIENYEYMNSTVITNNSIDVDSFIKITFEDNITLFSTTDQLIMTDEGWVKSEDLYEGQICKISKELSYIDEIEIQNVEKVNQKYNIFYDFSFVLPNGIFFVERIMVSTSHVKIEKN